MSESENMLTERSLTQEYILMFINFYEISRKNKTLETVDLWFPGLGPELQTDYK